MTEKKRILEWKELTEEQQERQNQYHKNNQPRHRFDYKHYYLETVYDLIFYSDGTTKETSGDVMMGVVPDGGFEKVDFGAKKPDASNK